MVDKRGPHLGDKRAIDIRFVDGTEIATDPLESNVLSQLVSETVKVWVTEVSSCRNGFVVEYVSVEKPSAGFPFELVGRTGGWEFRHRLDFVSRNESGFHKREGGDAKAATLVAGFSLGAG